MIIYWNPVGKGWTILDHSKHLFMFNLDFLNIADFRSIEFVETLNQRKFDELPLWDTQTVIKKLRYLIGCHGNCIFLRFGQR